MRLRQLGGGKVRVDAVGNLKHDQPYPDEQVLAGRALRRVMGNRPIWIAASTREGEEEPIFEAFDRVRERFPNLLLLLVPRHPERFNQVAKLCADRGYRLVRRTEAVSEVAADVDVFLGDTLGELSTFYAAADLAFIGGSLAPLGGHNALEAAVLSVPVVIGPNYFNATEVTEALIAANAAYCVDNAESLAERVNALLDDASLREKMGASGRAFVKEGRGALGRVLELIRSSLR
ncbi:3-deoxy-D-manno-octulosonic acid transferase [Alkalilimnicola ehrlichii]